MGECFCEHAKGSDEDRRVCQVDEDSSGARLTDSRHDVLRLDPDGVKRNVKTGGGEDGLDRDAIYLAMYDVDGVNLDAYVVEVK